MFKRRSSNIFRRTKEYDVSEGEADNDSEQKISDSFDIALRYEEQPSTLTPTDMLVLRCYLRSFSLWKENVSLLKPISLLPTVLLINLSIFIFFHPWKYNNFSFGLNRIQDYRYSNYRDSTVPISYKNVVPFHNTFGNLNIVFISVLVIQ